MKEKTLLQIIFFILDKVQYSFPQPTNFVFNLLGNLYGRDVVDVTNIFYDYCWAEQDGVDPNEVLARLTETES